MIENSQKVPVIKSINPEKSDSSPFIAFFVQFEYSDRKVRQAGQIGGSPPVPQEKKATMDTYCVPYVNHIVEYRRGAIANFTDIYQIQAHFKDKVDAQFDKTLRAIGVV